MSHRFSFVWPLWLLQVLLLSTAYAQKGEVLDKVKTFYFRTNAKYVKLQPIADEYIVQFKSSADAEAGALKAKELGLSARIHSSSLSVKVHPNSHLHSLMTVHGSREKVKQLVQGTGARVEQNCLIRSKGIPSKNINMATSANPSGFDGTPNDTYFNLQWSLETPDFSQIWDQSTDTASNVTVFVMDGRADIHHVDLKMNLRGVINLYTQSLGVDIGYHASHVTGILAAQGNNGLGVAGAMWGANVYNLQVADYDDRYGEDIFDEAAIISALYCAADCMPENTTRRVVNMSFGGYLYSPLEAQAIQHALDKDVVLVAAAGNETLNVAFHYPSAYPGVISIGATDKGKVLFSSSDWGSNFGEITTATPGVNILNTIPGNFVFETMQGKNSTDGNYAWLDGTSMSTPLAIGGAVAPILNQRPEAHYYEMRNILSQNSSQAVARDLPYPYLRFADAVRNGEDPNTPLGLPPTPNYFRASGNVDLGSANYSSDIGRFHFEGTIEEHDSVSTNIRWFVAVDDPTGTVYPVALTKLPTCSRQVGNGTNISYVCTPQNFAIDLDVSVSNYVPQDYQGWPTFYVTAMVEDRDGDDNVVALNPVVFSDGSTAVKVDTIAQ